MKNMLQEQISFFDGRDNFFVSPKHTTHSGGKGEYLHDWYAYLEGYSSEFVRSVYSSYMPNSRLILEPFAGVGTTPLTLSLDGVNSVYCEVNPAMRRVINTKLTVAALPQNRKEILYSDLIKLSEELPNLVVKSKEDTELSQTYIQAFNDSEFFTEHAYSNVLRLRATNDKISRENPLLGSALQIAVISKLVECSKLKRAGDVRYKTKIELEKGIPDLIKSVQEHLILMANDCRRCPQSTGTSKLLASNAKKLCSIESVNADGLITSPPYLNGTNYFRNTKLELWYMRDIVDTSSLRGFRDEVVTSGINDVTKNKGNIIHASIEHIVKDLYENAYDKRISKMVSGYFEEMAYVLEGAAHHLTKGSIACIDIGDSIYAGIHVPTHEILSEIAKEYGFNTIEIVKLRERKSRDKSQLTQSLIVLEKNGKPKATNNYKGNNKALTKTEKYMHKWEM